MSDNIWPGLIDLMETKPALIAELGDPIRVRPLRLEQKEVFPAATYRMVSQIGNRTFDGASEYDFNMLEIHVYAELIDDVERIVGLIRREIEDTTGTFAGVVINGISYVDSGGNEYSDELEKHIKSIEFKVDTRRNS